LTNRLLFNILVKNKGNEEKSSHGKTNREFLLLRWNSWKMMKQASELHTDLML